MTRLLFVILVYPWQILLSQSVDLDSVNQALRGLAPAERIKRLYAISNQRSNSDLTQSRQIAEAGLALAVEQHEILLTLDGYVLLGDLALDIPDFKYADSILQLALNLAADHGASEQLLKSKYSYAKYLSRSGQWAEANAWLDEIITTSVGQHNTLMEARAYMTKGLTYSQNSAYETAIQYYYKALPIYQKLGEQHRIGIVHTNIGLAFINLKRYPEALDEFNTAFGISQQEKDMDGILANTLNTGVVYQRSGQYEEATQAYQKCLSIAIAMQSWYDIALAIANLGTTAWQQGKNKEALTLLQRAYHIKDSIGYSSDLPPTLNSLSEVYLALHDPDHALSSAHEALRIAALYHRPDQVAESHRILAEAYADQADYQSAFHHMVIYKQLTDSIFTTESDNTISKLNVQYETKQKENQITELQARNKRNKREQLIFLGIAFLILLTASSLIYALYLRRSRDKLIITNERELHDRQNQFFANISHEFRTPLTLILGPLHTLRQKFRNTKDDKALGMIQKNAERLLQLINQILDLTRLEMKALELRKEWFDATGKIRGIASSFDSMAEARHIQYAYAVESNLVLHADIRRFEIVLLNLISNAFKFTPDYGQINVTAGICKDDGAFELNVSDNGVGVTEEDLPKIFDRYFHNDREAHADFEGTGIGLALSKNIMEMHGGTITVRSKLHEGSVFTVVLPGPTAELPIHLQDIQSMPAGDFKNPEPDSPYDEKMPPPARDRPLLLLIEDRTDMRDYITSVLQDHYRIIQASNAIDGREKALDSVPALVISDVMMPGKDGLELCRELKSDLRTSHIPVILLTARSSAEDRISGLETEADVYLTKPFIPKELELHIQNLLANRKKTAAYYAQHHRIEPSSMAFNSLDKQFLESFLAQLEAHYTDEFFSVEHLAILMNLSRSQLHRKLTALTGQPPNRLIRTFRLKKAFDLVAAHAATISEIAYKVGFNSPAYFTKCFVEEFNVTPMEIQGRILNT